MATFLFELSYGYRYGGYFESSIISKASRAETFLSGNVVKIGPNAIVDREDFMSEGELAEFATARELERWKSDGEIFAIEHDGVLLYPRYGFYFGSGFRPRPVMSWIISALHDYDAWHRAFWFSSGYGMLDGRRPQDVIETDPVAVLAAVRDQAMGITHG